MTRTPEGMPATSHGGHHHHERTSPSRPHAVAPRRPRTDPSYGRYPPAGDPRPSSAHLRTPYSSRLSASKGATHCPSADCLTPTGATSTGASLQTSRPPAGRLIPRALLISAHPPDEPPSPRTPYPKEAAPTCSSLLTSRSTSAYSIPRKPPTPTTSSHHHHPCVVPSVALYFPPSVSLLQCLSQCVSSPVTSYSLTSCAIL